jgi:hypothetical protein
MIFSRNNKITFNDTHEKVDDFREQLVSYHRSQDNTNSNETNIYRIKLEFINNTSEYSLKDWTDYTMNNFTVITKSKLAALIMLGDYMNKYFSTKNPIDWFQLMAKKEFNINNLDNWIEETFYNCIEITDDNIFNTIKKCIIENNCNILGYSLPYYTFE